MARKKYHSPTSINTYLRCPRKYYLKYIRGLKEKPSIYLVRGIAVHEALAKFFNQCFFNIYDSDRSQGYLKALFQDAWVKQNSTIKKLNIDPKVISNFYNDSIDMLMRWSLRFITRASLESKKPRTEVRYFSRKLNLMGIIDAVYEHNGAVILIDYKTSKHDEITEEIRVQMGIYSLLYQDNTGKKPDVIGIDFLKTGTRRFFKVSENMVEKAKRLCREITIKTSSENIADYPCRCGGWCEKDFVFDNENTPS